MLHSGRHRRGDWNLFKNQPFAWTRPLADLSDCPAQADAPPSRDGREDSAHRVRAALNFNREIVCGECGSLLAAYAAAYSAAHFTRQATIISGSVVGGTLAGGTLFWLAARIANQRNGGRWSARVLANDIGYFTPAAVILGFLVYDPVIFLVSRGLLLHGAGVAFAVIAAQAAAFALFLASMNLYRIILERVRGKRL
jgi:hypothetical protein